MAGSVQNGAGKSSLAKILAGVVRPEGGNLFVRDQEGNLSGLATGWAGVIHAARNHQGNPNDGMAYELDASTAVVIGGTPRSGGQGRVFGTVVGTLIMGIPTNILRLRLSDANLELMIKAVITVRAVGLQSG